MEKRIIGVAVLGLLLAGCVNPAPNLESQFGEAVRTARAQQTLNPGAALNTDPVTGIDGQAGLAALDSYHKSYETPPEPASLSLSIGGVR